ncbi:MAG: ATP-dependent Clp protease adapter ClpS [Mariprofundaceae bacterium]|nr:ATP-dependent Clp protease adapter ClpS [Mariprofundaceae bacterium]
MNIISLPPQSSVAKPDLAQDTKIQPPSMYRILLLNDDFTPMDFVVDVLKQLFHKTEDESIQLMLQIHHQGQATCGVYSYEVADQKVQQVNHYSQKHQHPLKCIMEKDRD